LPTILETWRAKCVLPQALCFSFAALIRFYQGDGVVYEIRDDEPVLEFFRVNRHRKSDEITRAFLSRADFWGEDLTLVPELVETVANHLQNIEDYGIRGCYEKLANSSE
jgi:tagaturonate reductase